MSYQILTFNAFNQKESMKIINNYTLSSLVYIMHSKNKKFNQEHIKRAQMLEVLLLDKNKNVVNEHVMIMTTVLRNLMKGSSKNFTFGSITQK